MLNIFSKIYNSLFPLATCVKLLQPERSAGFIRNFSPHYYMGSVVLASYDQPLIQAAINANKFHDYRPAAKLLAALLNHWFKTMPETKTILVPIPLSPARLKNRGYNQVLRILEQTDPSQAKVQFLLSREKNTKPQTSLKREARFKNVETAFNYQPPERPLVAKRIIIVDDVITTGATMRAAYNALAPHLPPECEIITLALAH